MANIFKTDVMTAEQLRKAQHQLHRLRYENPNSSAMSEVEHRIREMIRMQSQQLTVPHGILVGQEKKEPTYRVMQTPAFTVHQPNMLVGMDSGADGGTTVVQSSRQGGKSRIMGMGSRPDGVQGTSIDTVILDDKAIRPLDDTGPFPNKFEVEGVEFTMMGEPFTPDWRVWKIRGVPEDGLRLGFVVHEFDWAASAGEPVEEFERCLERYGFALLADIHETEYDEGIDRVKMFVHSTTEEFRSISIGDTPPLYKVTVFEFEDGDSHVEVAEW